MKATELIEKIKEIVLDNGDLEIVTGSGFYPYLQNIDTVYLQDDLLTSTKRIVLDLE